MEHSRRLTGLVDRGSILLVVYAAFSGAVVEGLWKQIPLTALAGVVLIDCLLLLIVMVTMWALSALFGFDRADRITILFCGSKKSLASGVPIANVLFTGSIVGPMILPLMLFHQIQLMVCAALAQRWARPDRMVPPATSHRHRTRNHLRPEHSYARTHGKAGFEDTRRHGRGMRCSFLLVVVAFGILFIRRDTVEYYLDHKFTVERSGVLSFGARAGRSLADHRQQDRASPQREDDFSRDARGDSRRARKASTSKRSCFIPGKLPRSFAMPCAERARAGVRVRDLAGRHRLEHSRLIKVMSTDLRRPDVRLPIIIRSHPGASTV